MAKKSKKNIKMKSYDLFLKKELQDPEQASLYLSAAAEDNSAEGFLVALRNVAQAHGGLGVLSKITSLNLQNMYKMFSEDGNPTVSSLIAVLNAIGINLSFSPQERKLA